MEHRWGRRLAVDIPIRLSVPLFTAKRGRLTNISLSGGFITTDADVRVLSHLQIVFEGPRRSQTDVVTISAYVARKAGDGLGVEWCDFAPAVVADLIKTIAARQSQDSGRDSEALAAPRLAASGGKRLKHGPTM